ncbi:MAG: hypothetical protein K5770_17080 [Lachnospiraceae bacterium]|nr:hypothetical protein [Lachnospiraceae bacterium]
MIFESRGGGYEAVSSLLHGKVNDCYVAKNVGNDNGVMYTLVVLHDHDTVLSLLEVYGEASDYEGPLIETFSSGQDFVLVFPYRTERALKDFYVGEAYTLERCEEICFNLILTCMTSGIKSPILYLILNQWLLNIARDDNIYLSYRMDFEPLDITLTERDCATECADILLELLSSKAREKSVVYELLQKKVANKSYSTFTELYRDMRIAATPVKKGNIIRRIKAFFHRNSDTLFGILFWVCLIAAIVAIILLITNLVVGDIPFLRLFYNSFKKIGTESLVQ